MKLKLYYFSFNLNDLIILFSYYEIFKLIFLLVLWTIQIDNYTHIDFISKLYTSPDENICDCS